MNEEKRICFFLRRKRKGLLLALSLTVLCMAAMGGTFAFLSAKSDTQVTNEWKMMRQPAVTVSVDGNGVAVTVKLREQNGINATDQEYAVYLRAKPEFFWMGSTLTIQEMGAGGGIESMAEEASREWEGTILGEKPEEGVDYKVAWNTSDWFQGADGYYYYRNPVAVTAEGKKTAVLYQRMWDDRVRFNITEKCAAQCVQASGTTAADQKAVNDAWGDGIVVNEDGTLGIAGSSAPSP